MRYLSRLLLLVLFFLAFLTVFNPSAQTFSQVAPKASAPPQTQMVRLSYVQGYVKVSTGVNGKPDLDKDWAVAGVNFPVEEGTTVATEQGRAEVEFENGSMIYLAEQSVLQFRWLSATAVGTTTKVTLLTGRATIDFASNGYDEIYLKTADLSLHLTTPRVLRVDTALDGAVFRVVEGQFQFTGATPPLQPFSAGPGDAFQCVDGVLSPEPNLVDDADQKSWDQWVNEERMERKADIATGLQEAGLAAPIPGLADLVRGGTFSDCPPYGKCWEPNLAESSSGAAAPSVAASAASPSQIPTPASTSIPNANAARNCDATVNPGVRCVWETEDLGQFNYYEGPCGRGPMSERHLWMNKLVLYTPQDPLGKVLQKNLSMQDLTNPYSAATNYPGWWRFPWATCRAGSWVPVAHPERFACKPEKGGKPGKCPPPKKWVVGPKRKTGSFVRVRMGRTEGFIPKHPLDKKGKPPLNAEDGILTFKGNGAEEQEKLVETPKNLQVLGTDSATYEANWRKALPKIERPVIEGKLFRPSSELAGQDIRYDYKSKNFVTSAKATEGSGEKYRPIVVAHVGANKIYSGNGAGGGGNSGQSGSRSGGSSATARNSSHGNSESRGSTSSRSSSESRGSSQSYSSSASESRAASPPSSPAPSSPRH
jgi:hypothetical protein